jgi:DoxX-like protein
MKARAIAYWICTALVAFSFLSGGIVDVMRMPQALEGMTHLGYPPYFMVILGVWKILGGVVILLPGLAVVKEWAYAGMIFDLTGATASHLATGDDVGHVVVPLVLAALVVASWALRPESRRLRWA